MAGLRGNFSRGALVDPFSNLMQAMGGNGAMAKSLIAKDQKEQFYDDMENKSLLQEGRLANDRLLQQRRAASAMNLMNARQDKIFDIAKQKDQLVADATMDAYGIGSMGAGNGIVNQGPVGSVIPGMGQGTGPIMQAGGGIPGQSQGMGQGQGGAPMTTEAPVDSQLPTFSVAQPVGVTNENQIFQTMLQQAQQQGKTINKPFLDALKVQAKANAQQATQNAAIKQKQIETGNVAAVEGLMNMPSTDWDSNQAKAQGIMSEQYNAEEAALANKFGVGTPEYNAGMAELTDATKKIVGEAGKDLIMNKTMDNVRANQEKYLERLNPVAQVAARKKLQEREASAIKAEREKYGASTSTGKKSTGNEDITKTTKKKYNADGKVTQETTTTKKRGGSKSASPDSLLASSYKRSSGDDLKIFDGKKKGYTSSKSSKLQTAKNNITALKKSAKTIADEAIDVTKEQEDIVNYNARPGYYKHVKGKDVHRKLTDNLDEIIEASNGNLSKQELQDIAKAEYQVDEEDGRVDYQVRDKSVDMLKDYMERKGKKIPKIQDLIDKMEKEGKSKRTALASWGTGEETPDQRRLLTGDAKKEVNEADKIFKSAMSSNASKASYTKRNLRNPSKSNIDKLFTASKTRPRKSVSYDGKNITPREAVMLYNSGEISKDEYVELSKKIK